MYKPIASIKMEGTNPSIVKVGKMVAFINRCFERKGKADFTITFHLNETDNVGVEVNTDESISENKKGKFFKEVTIDNLESFIRFYIATTRYLEPLDLDEVVRNIIDDLVAATHLAKEDGAIAIVKKSGVKNEILKISVSGYPDVKVDVTNCLPYCDCLPFNNRLKKSEAYQGYCALLELNDAFKSLVDDIIAERCTIAIEEELKTLLEDKVIERTLLSYDIYPNERLQFDKTDAVYLDKNITTFDITPIKETLLGVGSKLTCKAYKVATLTAVPQKFTSVSFTLYHDIDFNQRGRYFVVIDDGSLNSRHQLEQVEQNRFLYLEGAIASIANTITRFNLTKECFTGYETVHTDKGLLADVKEITKYNRKEVVFAIISPPKDKGGNPTYEVVKVIITHPFFAANKTKVSIGGIELSLPSDNIFDKINRVIELVKAEYTQTDSLTPPISLNYLRKQIITHLLDEFV